MQIFVNDQAKTVDDAISIATLLRLEGLEGRRIAVEHNGEIVPKSAYLSTELRPGDCLEIVHAIGGG